MVCPSCGNRNREGARFCDGCGSPLEQATASAGLLLLGGAWSGLTIPRLDDRGLAPGRG